MPASVVKIYVVAERETGKAVGVFSEYKLAREWMLASDLEWPEYTVQTWIADSPGEGYEEWI